MQARSLALQLLLALPAAPAPRRRSLILFATTLGFMVVQLDVTIVNVALQSISSSLGGDVADLQWIVDAYTIVFASTIPAAGALGDRIGAKRLLVAGFAIFTLASLACGLAPSLPTLIAARIMQGLGAAILVPCSLALLNHGYDDEKARAKAVAIWATGASVALAAGPLLGGILVTTVGWRSIFLVNLPLGALGIWLTLRFAWETAQTKARGLDLAGQASVTLALASLAAATIEGGRLGLSHPLAMAGFAAFAASSVVFVLAEAKGRDPILPPAFFANATFPAAIGVGLLINISFYGLIFLLSLLLQKAEGFTPLRAGVAFLPMTSGVLIANLVVGQLTAAKGVRIPMLCGLLTFLLGCIALALTGRLESINAIWWQFLLIGGGMGLIVPPMTSAVLGTVPREKSGIASGALNATRQAGSVMGVALYGALIANANAASALALALDLTIALLTISIVATAALVERRRTENRPVRGVPERRSRAHWAARKSPETIRAPGPGR